MNTTSKIFIIFALMCVSATAAFSQQDCNNYLKLAAELVSQKKYCDALSFYRKYSACNPEADVSTEMALCERYCKLDGGTVEPVTKTEQNPAPPNVPNVSPKQDIITLKDGNDIQAIVQEIGDTDVKYKKYDNLNGPSYTLKKSEIFMIRYANGSKDIFNAIATPAPVETKQQTAVNQQNSPYNSSYNSQEQLPVQYGSKKSPGLAGFLSFLIPGVGQFYNGEVGKGFMYMGINILCNYLWMNTDDETVFAISLGCGVGNNIASMLDAYSGAKKVNIARGYRIADNVYLKVKPTMIQQKNSLTGKDYAYGMNFCLNF